VEPATTPTKQRIHIKPWAAPATPVKKSKIQENLACSERLKNMTLLEITVPDFIMDRGAQDKELVDDLYRLNHMFHDVHYIETAWPRTIQHGCDSPCEVVHVLESKFKDFKSRVDNDAYCERYVGKVTYSTFQLATPFIAIRGPPGAETWANFKALIRFMDPKHIVQIGNGPRDNLKATILFDWTGDYPSHFKDIVLKCIENENYWRI
jgi:hypothetical protein